jgi:hypothetical protein
MTSARDLKLMLVVCALFLALAEAVFAGGLSADVLLAAPFFVLIVPLLGGRYVGEGRLDRLRRAVAARRRPRRVVAGVPLTARRPAFVLGRGGRAVAGAFFCRPPPVLVRIAP